MADRGQIQIIQLTKEPNLFNKHFGAATNMGNEKGAFNDDN